MTTALRPNRSGRITATKFAAIYVIWSVFWVVLSDYALQLVLHGPTVEWRLESFKGVIYVLVSGFILFLAVRERDRKHRAERAANESMLRGLRQSGLVGIYEWDTQGRITDANSSFLDALGYTREELESGKLTGESLTPSDHREADRIALQQVSETGHCALYETQVICKDGSRLDVLVGKSLLEGFPEHGVGYALDITDLKRARAEKAKLEQQLTEAEKLSALGQLAGGIAHDFNNLLSVIIGYESLTESSLRSGDPLRENTSQVLRAAEKAKNLIRKLLAFSRKEVLSRELINVNELILELHGILSRVLDERIKLVLRLGKDVGNIEANASQIEQVIVNLVINARDAMPHGGSLTIETQSIVFQQPTCRPDQAGEFVVIRITDTGTGISPEIKSRIFEPFFTTKRERGGTGLGLAMVYGIVKQSGGYLTVESTPGEGSVFTAHFPRARVLQIVSPKPAQSAVPVVGGRETILLVEDLDELRQVMSVTLQSKGYLVIPARDGEDAIRTAESFPGEIHLVVTDVIMPRMNGPDAVQQLRRIRPNIKVIFMTGYAEQSLKSIVPFSVTVEKPLRPETLLGKVRELLDEDRLHRAS